MLTHVTAPLLPAPRSWYPGHMTQFARMLPALLTRTDIVLELRDARLPLTSINRTFEGHLQKWRSDRLNSAKQAMLVSPDAKQRVCERIVVFSKRDLVPQWGIEPFRRAMASRFPNQRVFFASWKNSRDIKELSSLLVNIAKEHPYIRELNVLVVGMPNVGKSTLLNALRTVGIEGRTAKALRTSALPGMTRSLSNRLKISEDPLVYSFDTPGVMLPYLGSGSSGAERGVKLALIAGMKESLYDNETLSAYLLYRLNALNPISPAYLPLLSSGSKATNDLEEFLTLLANNQRLLIKGNMPDLARAAARFVRWWREEGGRVYARAALPDASVPGSRAGWGFDMEWEVEPGERADIMAIVQRKMEACIDAHTRSQAEESEDMSATQMKKREVEERKRKIRERAAARWAGKKARR
ncbi:P-loop containing nucleoside triphosphate hydrolase protein [Vararia minispora EC-137]|uniref:P-loop containing nucleoside triphosphate hydrolase protein n=1 Tax=Vararia minispora EC-137 TaxID=1314806 RepID=A0ACB8QV93_9AGAM|nr:P-loop containing nucleoside triphosphate hydrolase protein [Vararia minispora EC-137]